MNHIIQHTDMIIFSHLNKMYIYFVEKYIVCALI